MTHILSFVVGFSFGWIGTDAFVKKSYVAGCLAILGWISFISYMILKS